MLGIGEKTMPEIKGNCIYYTADDEMPECLYCDNFCGGFDCVNMCGAKHGWYGYRRTERRKEKCCKNKDI